MWSAVQDSDGEHGLLYFAAVLDMAGMAMLVPKTAVSEATRGAGRHGRPAPSSLDGTRTRIFRFVKAGLYPLSYKELAPNIHDAWQCSVRSALRATRTPSPLIRCDLLSCPQRAHL